MAKPPKPVTREEYESAIKLSLLMAYNSIQLKRYDQAAKALGLCSDFCAELAKMPLQAPKEG